MDAETRRDLALAIAAKAAIGAIVLAGGFRAVSDDDFARVVHAQEFARAPRLDPTGTSWLPFPFWLAGGAMRLFGTSLVTARAVAFACGLFAAALVFAAARMLVADRRGALVGALLAGLFPWSARLGVAVVPELLAAALSVFAVATLSRDGASIRWLGAAALFVATLSRYEPWLVAGAFAAFSLWDCARGARERASIAGAALFALVGPALWIAHNASVHGEALHFLARVSAYKRAVDPSEPTLLAALAGYPLSLLREEPELCCAALALVLVARPLRPPSLARTSAALALLLVLLTAASIPGGAPTHHAGRALLAIWLALAIYVGAGAHHAITGGALGKQRRQAYAALTLAAVIGGAFVLRPWYARLDSFITRADEIAIGAAAAHHSRPDERILVEVIDYGHFAIQAGSGAPERFVLDRFPDPGAPAPAFPTFVSELAIRDRARRAGATYLVARRTHVTHALGPPLATHGIWSLWSLEGYFAGCPSPRPEG
jgi:hypothetical protein